MRAAPRIVAASVAASSGRAEHSSPKPLGIDKRRVLTRSEAREVYDALEVKDSASAYGKPLVQAVLGLGEFEEASSVYEFGSGAGLFAERLLRDHLSASCSYVGVDASPPMIERARGRQPSRAAGAAPADFVLVDPDPLEGVSAAAEGSIDRYVSLYVYDLLSERDVAAALETARRLLHPERGRLIVGGLAYGDPYTLRWVVSKAWDLIHAVQPKIVGGCRPQELQPYVEAAGFEVLALERVSGAYITSEVILAKPAGPPAGAE